MATSFKEIRSFILPRPTIACWCQLPTVHTTYVAHVEVKLAIREVQITN